MKNIKIISMDFDGTLLTSDKMISDRTRKCLINLKNKSYIIIGVTARNILSVKNILDVSLFDYIILNNGADLYYVKEDKVLNVSSIEYETIERLFNMYKDISSQIDFCTSYKYLIRSKEKGDNRSFIEYIDGLDDIENSVSRMNIFFKDDEELEKNRTFLEDNFNNIEVVKMIDTDRSNSRVWLALNPKDVSKSSALKKICEDLNHTIDEVVFFGDGENDLSLIENAGIGVAMGNALDSVKEKADYITLSNDKDGIVEFLESNLK